MRKNPDARDKMALSNYSEKQEIPQKEEVFEVLGRVTNTKRLDNGTLIDIRSEYTKKEFKAECPFFCPARKNDVISGFCCRNNRGVGHYLFIYPPAVEIAADPEAIKTAFIIALRGTNFGRAKSENLYGFFLTKAKTDLQLKIHSNVTRNRSGEIGAVIVESLSVMANQYKTDPEVARSLVTHGLKLDQAKKLLTWWYRSFSLRRLYLLGLTKTEIRKACGNSLSMDELYYKLLENPYTIIDIPMEKATIIATKNRNYFSQDIIEAANLVRYVKRIITYRKWVCCPVFEIRRKFSRFKQLETTLKKDFKCAIRYNCLYLEKDSQTENFLTNVLVSEKLVETHCSEKTKKKLIEEQVKAVDMALNNSISIITGSAGTGKTTIIASIAKELDLRGLEYIVCSYTGKAVSRLKEVIPDTDCAMTLHMILARGIQNTRMDYIIVDEISMVHNGLLASVLRKLINKYDKINIVLVGDPNQVQPIESGDLFNQLIDADTIPIVRLMVDHRRGKKGALRTNTANYAIAEFPDQFKFIWGDDCIFQEGGISIVASLVKTMFMKGIDHQQITVISPYNKDLDEINTMCQNIIIPQEIPRKRDNFGNIWTVGTRVMMTKNCYDINVMNGEEGIVKTVSSHMPVITVEFKNGEVVDIPTFLPEINMYDKNNTGDEDADGLKEEPLSTKLLKLSWAITVHKSQGSEWKVVIYYIQTEYRSTFVNRNLAYTAFSRAKEILFVVTESKDKFLSSLYIEPPWREDNLGKRLKQEVYTDTFEFKNFVPSIE